MLMMELICFPSDLYVSVSYNVGIDPDDELNRTIFLSLEKLRFMILWVNCLPKGMETHSTSTVLEMTRTQFSSIRTCNSTVPTTSSFSSVPYFRRGQSQTHISGSFSDSIKSSGKWLRLPPVPET